MPKEPQRGFPPVRAQKFLHPYIRMMVGMHNAGLDSELEAILKQIKKAAPANPPRKRKN